MAVFNNPNLEESIDDIKVGDIILETVIAYEPPTDKIHECSIIYYQYLQKQSSQNTITYTNYPFKVIYKDSDRMFLLGTTPIAQNISYDTAKAYKISAIIQCGPLYTYRGIMRFEGSLPNLDKLTKLGVEQQTPAPIFIEGVRYWVERNTDKETNPFFVDGTKNIISNRSYSNGMSLIPCVEISIKGGVPMPVELLQKEDSNGNSYKEYVHLGVSGTGKIYIKEEKKMNYFETASKIEKALCNHPQDSINILDDGYATCTKCGKTFRLVDTTNSLTSNEIKKSCTDVVDTIETMKILDPELEKEYKLIIPILESLPSRFEEAVNKNIATKRGHFSGTDTLSNHLSNHIANIINNTEDKGEDTHLND